MADASADEVIKFVTVEIMHTFGAPRLIISDNATCFTATKPIDIMKAHGIKWKTVLACAPMSNGRAERMVEAMKRGMKKLILSSSSDWQEVLPGVLHGYRCRHLAESLSPYELL